MKIRLLLVFVCLLLCVGVFADETKSQELYNKGMEYVQKAEATDSSSEKKELYAEASDCFNDILKNKKTKDTPEAIYAQYELAKIQAASGDPKLTQRAYESLKMLVVRWDKTDAELDKAGFTTKEIIFSGQKSMHLPQPLHMSDIFAHPRTRLLGFVIE